METHRGVCSKYLLIHFKGYWSLSKVSENQSLDHVNQEILYYIHISNQWSIFLKSYTDDSVEFY